MNLLSSYQKGLQQSCSDMIVGRGWMFLSRAQAFKSYILMMFLVQFLSYSTLFFVFNPGLLNREVLMRFEKFVSFISLAGQTTACRTMRQACWDLYGRSSPRARQTLDLWWFTAGRQNINPSVVWSTELRT